MQARRDTTRAPAPGTDPVPTAAMRPTLPPCSAQRPRTASARRQIVVARLVALAAIGALTAGIAQALGGVSTTTGRQVPARADAPSVSTPRDARGQYVLHCAGCHGFDGRGAPQAYVPDLTRMGQWLPVAGGRAYLIKVPGVMASGLDDAQVAAVTNWLLATLARPSVPEGHRPYDAAEVAQARRQPFTDVAAERQRLIGVAQAAGLAVVP